MPWGYPLYTSLSEAEKLKITARYQHNFLDFDNDIIIHSAAEVLYENDFHDFHLVQVGPDKKDETFCLGYQLVEKISFEKRYTFFALPTTGGRHSVGVVIDTYNKECHVIDSLNRDYEEAIVQLENAIDLGVLAYYALIRPIEPIVQQTDTINCGVHTAANIVGIILGDIDIRTHKGIQQRNEAEVTDLLGIFCKAYEQAYVKRAAKLHEPLLDIRGVVVIRCALNELKKTIIDNEVLGDITILEEAIDSNYPRIAGADDTLHNQLPLMVFITHFCEKNPANVLVRHLECDEFFKLLPTRMEDDVASYEALACAYFVSLNLTNKASSSSGASSSQPACSSFSFFKSVPQSLEEFMLDQALQMGCADEEQLRALIGDEHIDSLREHFAKTGL